MNKEINIGDIVLSKHNTGNEYKVVEKNEDNSQIRVNYFYMGKCRKRYWDNQFYPITMFEKISVSYKIKLI